MVTSKHDPIFIVGCPRSGTTFLQSLLSSHSRMIIPPEDDFILRLRRQLHEYDGVELQQTEVESLLDDLYSPDHAFANWDLPRDVLSEQLSQPISMTPMRFVEVVHESYLRRFPGKSRWGCKVPYFASHLLPLASLFPSGKFIHLVRDGRDTYLSMKDRNRAGARHFPTTATRAARIWNKLVSAASNAGEQIEEQYKEIRYEELVTDVGSTLESICYFLGEPFSEQMISDHFENLQLHQHRRRSDLDRYVKQQVDAANIERWKREMNPKEIYEYQSIAGSTLVAHGYSLTENREWVGLGTKIRTRCCQFAYHAWDGRRRWIRN